MSNNTKIHGIGAAENIDSSGEKIDLSHLDCTSLDKGDGTYTFEHSGTEPSKILGKILKYKKIFSEADCETPEHTYFFQKAGCPILYVMGELFDGDGHLQAEEVASIFRYDARQKNEQTSVPPTMWFSVEGSILNKQPEGGIKQITDAICRLVTITVKPCNRVCVAELYEPKEAVDENDPLAFLKSEISYIALTKSMKPVLEFLPAEKYSDFTPDDHIDAANAHYTMAAHSKNEIFEYHMAKSEEHLKKARIDEGKSDSQKRKARDARHYRYSEDGRRNNEKHIDKVDGETHMNSKGVHLPFAGRGNSRLGAASKGHMSYGDKQRNKDYAVAEHKKVSAEQKGIKAPSLGKADRNAYVKGVHTPKSNHSPVSGRSAAGNTYRNSVQDKKDFEGQVKLAQRSSHVPDKDVDTIGRIKRNQAVASHKKVLSDLKHMPTPNLGKALGAGGMGGAPGTQVGGAALQKEHVRKKLDKAVSQVKNLEKMGEFISKKYKLNKSEGLALAKMLVFRKIKG